MPNVFLAAAAASSAALLLLRLSNRRSTVLIAVATLSALVAAVTVTAMPSAVVGAALATSAVGLLALAPRLSMLAAGLGPDQNGLGDSVAATLAGHVILSGLVAGSAAGAAAGAVVTAASGHSGAAPFAGLMGLVLLLRGRTYVDPDRRTCLAAAGLTAAVAATWALLTARPEGLDPVAGLLVVVALVAMRRRHRPPGPNRWLDRLEYCALAAVVPASCWVGGAFAALSRGGLP